MANASTTAKDIVSCECTIPPVVQYPKFSSIELTRRKAVVEELEELVRSLTDKTSKKKSKQGVSPMYVRYADDDSMTSMDAQKKNYLLGRLSDIETKKDHELSKKYNMYEDPRPDSAEELVERIKSGKFSITPRPEKGRKYDYSPMDRIVWRDPAAVKDEESYEKARDVLDLLKTKAQDQIWVGDDVTGLKALEEFAAAEVTIQ